METDEEPFFLVPQPISLDEVVATVEAKRDDAFLAHQGFYRRKKALSGWFMSPDQVAQEEWYDMGHLLQRAPFVRTREVMGLGTLVSMPSRGLGGDCEPKIYMDGAPVPRGSLRDFVHPEDVLAVEVYRGVAQVPIEWGLWNTCGLILIWSQWGSMLSGS